MRDITAELEIGSPVIWITTSEPDRACDLIAKQVQDKPFYKMDPELGMVTNTPTGWMKTLVDFPDGEQSGTYSIIVALMHAVETKGVLVVKNAHMVAEKLLEALLDLFSKYRSSFLEDNYDTLPGQIICIAPNEEIPPELSHFCFAHYLDLPDQEELDGLVERFFVSDPLLVIADRLHIVRAGAGLSEQDFIKACILSARTHGELLPSSINDFRMERLKRNSSLEIVPSEVTLADVGGLDILKEMVAKIIWSWDNPEEALKMKLVTPKSMLLLGVPGSGKSLTAKAIAASMGIQLAKVGVSKALNMFIGNSEANIRNMFRQLAVMAPIVAWDDELGRDASQSSVINDGGTTSRVLGEFLSGMQDLPPKVLFVATANDISALPPELLRAGRIETIMFCGFPVQQERIQILAIHLDEEDEIDLEAVSAATSYFTGVELESLVQKVRFDKMGETAITTDDMLAAARTMRNRVWLKDRERYKSMYRRALVEYDWASSMQQELATLVIDERPLNEIGTGGVGVGADQGVVVKKFR